MKMKGPAIAAVIAIAIIIILIVIPVIYTIVAYNGLVTQEEDVDASWAEVENQYQRKFNLIPQIINITESYKEFENTTLTGITALRTQWANANSDQEKMDAANQLDTQFDATLKSIILTYESYPYLESVVVVRDLMVELEGTENRVTVARMRYNEDVRDFNKEIKKFPKVLVANSFGFEEREYFESNVAPENP